MSGPAHKLPYRRPTSNTFHPRMHHLYTSIHSITREISGRSASRCIDIECRRARNSCIYVYERSAKSDGICRLVCYRRVDVEYGGTLGQTIEGSSLDESNLRA